MQLAIDGLLLALDVLLFVLYVRLWNRQAHSEEICEDNFYQVDQAIQKLMERAK